MTSTKVLDKLYDILESRGYELNVERITNEDTSHFAFDGDIHFVARKTVGKLTIVLDMIVYSVNRSIFVSITANGKIMYTSAGIGKVNDNNITMGGREMVAIKNFFQNEDVFKVAKIFLEFVDFEEINGAQHKVLSQHIMVVENNLTITYDPGVGQYADIPLYSSMLDAPIVSPIVEIVTANDRRIEIRVAMDDFIMLVAGTQKYAAPGKYYNMFIRGMVDMLETEGRAQDDFFINRLRSLDEELNGKRTENECNI